MSENREITECQSTRFISFSWLYFFCLFNSKYAKFRLWTYNVLAGYKMLSQFENASFFRDGNWLIKEKTDSIEAPSPSEVALSSR